MVPDAPAPSSSKSKKKKFKPRKHGQSAVTRGDQLAAPNADAAGNSCGGTRHLNKGKQPDNANLPDVDPAKDRPVSKRAAKRRRARARKAALKIALMQGPEADVQPTKLNSSPPGSTTNSKAPQPGRAFREERAPTTNSEEYATVKSVPRQRAHRARPQPPATPNSVPVTSAATSGSSQVRRQVPNYVERATIIPTPIYASPPHPRTPRNRRRNDNSDTPREHRLYAGTSRRPDLPSVLQSSAPRTNPYLWRPEPQPQPEVSNILPCLICFDAPDKYPSHRPSSNCIHELNVCAPCLEAHISYAVQSEGLTTFHCPDPNCREVIPYEDVLRNVNNNTACLERYEALLLRGILKQDPNFVWCKNAACDWGQIHESGASAPIVTCQICETRSCFTHDMPWHAGLTCEQYDAQRATTTSRQDRATQAYINEHTKKCPGPRCGRPIEKNEGCDHMTCRRPAGCGHEFYWICLADYDPIRREGNHRHRTDCRDYRPERESSGCIIC